MSIFGSILQKIFPPHHPAAANTGNAGANPAAVGANAPASPAANAPAGAPAASAPTPAPAAASPSPAAAPSSNAAAPSAVPPVDVEAVLNGLATQNPQPLNWRTSIVDLMKLLQLDSSLSSRKELAKELGYSGDTSDSATMNVWLHKQVMVKLAANGGKVPDDLKG
jgi:hypothetical protein